MNFLYALIGADIAINIYLFIKNRQFMAERFEAVISRIDSATNKVAAELRELQDSVKDAGLSKAKEDEILAKLESAATKLEAVGKDEVEEGEEETGGSGPGQF